MLNCQIIHSADQKSQIIVQFNEKPLRWLVSDLDSKFWVQRQLTDGMAIARTDRAIRASELWKELLLKNDPSWQILASSMTNFLVEKWMSEILRDGEFGLSSKDKRRATQTIGQILPLLSHFEGDEAMEEWFAESEAANERWYQWYRLGRQLWQRFLNERLIPEEWIKGVLINELDLKVNDQLLVVDLGLEIDDVESELIINLSRYTDILVIVPSEGQSLEPYQNLLARCQPEEMSFDFSDQERIYKKFPSSLSEIKEAVARVRQWLDAGIDPKNIAIISPSVENYWPTLSEYLDIEGVPCQKPRVVPLSQYQIYQTWLASIRLAMGRPEGYGGEQLIYGELKEPIMPYQDYEVRFSNLYGVEDYQRDELVKQKIPESFELNQSISFDQFFAWALTLVPESQLATFDQLSMLLDGVSEVTETLRPEQWLQFFEEFFSRNEAKLFPGDPEGIVVGSVATGTNPQFEKMILFGLSEKDLQESQDTALHWTDIESIKIKFGFNLPHADRFLNIQKLKWLEKKNLSEICFFVSETDFFGGYQAPSFYWLEGAIAAGHDEELNTPQKTRWDELMIADPSHNVRLDTDIAEGLIARDLGIADEIASPLEEFSLSASSLEEFFKCPFRFYAAKGFGLTDLPSLDLDVDAMTKGRLIHRVCELIVSEDLLGIKNEEIDPLLERARKDIDMEVYNGQFWQIIKPLYVQMVKSFLQFENQWRQDFPNTKTDSVEKQVKTYIELTDEGFKFSDSGILFRGFIDRIDTNDNGQYSIVDYKSTGGSLKQWGSWLANGQLQLVLYSIALLEGAIDGEVKDPVGAFYYSMKPMERKKGFAIQESDKKFLDGKKMNREGRDHLFFATKQLVHQMVVSMKKGEFLPKPSHEKHCENCSWRQVCRAPHLNI